MNALRIVSLFAGSLIVTSLALARWVDHRWYLLAVFVGLNLFQAGLTGFCPLERILLKFGMPQGGCRFEQPPKS